MGFALTSFVPGWSGTGNGPSTIPAPRSVANGPTGGRSLEMPSTGWAIPIDMKWIHNAPVRFDKPVRKRLSIKQRHTGQLYASAKSREFESGPMTRMIPGECTDERIFVRASSGRIEPHQIWA
uniref:Uncharacterized protein n=1 Tax=Anopheles atroparvus TaxID=41427 RepID=A0A182IZ67_ANOAO